MPSLSSIDGLGEKAADAIVVYAAKDGQFLSKEDFMQPDQGQQDDLRSDGRPGDS